MFSRFIHVVICISTSAFRGWIIFHCIFYLSTYQLMYGEGNGNPLQDSSWRIPWTEEPGGLKSMGLQRVGHNWVTKHLCPSILNVWYQEWFVIYPMDFGWLWCVSVDSSIVNNFPLHCGMLTVRVVGGVWDRVQRRNLSNCLLNFAVNLRLL